MYHMTNDDDGSLGDDAEMHLQLHWMQILWIRTQLLACHASCCCAASSATQFS